MKVTANSVTKDWGIYSIKIDLVQHSNAQNTKNKTSYSWNYDQQSIESPKVSLLGSVFTDTGSGWVSLSDIKDINLNKYPLIVDSENAGLGVFTMVVQHISLTAKTNETNALDLQISGQIVSW